MAARKKRGRGQRVGRVSVRAAAGPDHRPALRPNYIVALPSSGEEGIGALAKVAKAGGVSTFAVPGRKVVALSLPGDAQPRMRYFPELGVATANLDSEERAQLEAIPKVRVWPNAERALPRSPDDRVVRGPAAVRGGGGWPVQPFGGGAWPVQPFVRAPFDSSFAYAQGFRDGVVYAFERPVRAPGVGSVAAGAAAVGGLTYGLSMLNIGGTAQPLLGDGVRVAVIDTGIDLNHPDFAGRVQVQNTRGFVAGNVSAQDDHGHGTHVAGTIAGPVNASPRYGVAPNVELYVAKVLDANGTGFDDDILEAIEWALGAGVRVLNLSLGSIRMVNGEYSTPYEVLMDRLLDRPDGALMIAAAGNESTRENGIISPVDNPAACPSVLAVAAVDGNGIVADFSCGQVDAIGAVDLAAPGVGIHSARLGGGYVGKSGTSMAAPHVCGVAALFFQQNPTLTPRQVWQRMQRQSALLGAPDSDVGAGLVQVP